MHTPRTFAAFARTLRNPNYGVYTLGNAISLIGTWVQRVAVGWLAWELTRSGAWLGVLALSDAIFTVVVGLLAGAAADRWDRLRIVKLGQVASLLQAVVLFALTATGTITMPRLLILTAFLGICTAFIQPARHALIPSLVSSSELPVAIAINSIVFNTARFIGPAIAGILIVALGIEAAFAANALSFVVFLVALGRIRVARAPEPATSRKTFATELIEGVRYTATHAAVGPLLAMLIVTSTAGRAVADLLPAFADVVFGGGPPVLAALTSSMGAGAIMAALLIAGNSEPPALIRTVLAGALAMGLALMAFTATDRLTFGIPALIVAGGCSTLIGVSTQTLILLAVPPTVRGRAMSIYGLIVWAGPGFGALVMGAWADAYGFRLPLAVGGLGIVGAWLWGLSRRKRIAAGLVPVPGGDLPGSGTPGGGQGRSH
ncbi:MFS transporter [Faunimonas sp. B44]|uniref:MFS transporter n=1 Tax=Faunimonas sp. B44 TaxID=3461493 RepID=UPI004043A608